MPENMLKYASFCSWNSLPWIAIFRVMELFYSMKLGGFLEVVASLESEEKEWTIALLEDGKIVHDAKISFSFDEIHGMIEATRESIYLCFVRSVPGIVVKKT